MVNYYPAFINLFGKRCVVVGGGKVAERKVMSLLRCGAHVKIISPALTDALERQKERGKVVHIKRTYRTGDLGGVFLVIAATGNERVNTKVSNDAPCLVNVVDVPETANFIVPSVVKRGPMTIAVSTSGASPAMAKRIRKELELIYNKDFGRYLNFLKQLRKMIMKEINDKKARERFLKELASQEFLNILRGKGFQKAKDKVLNRLKAEKI
ncbi:MAG: bifunctional precorrin-2 dehydrogenase/sirohydrochlorin ferrochelatase [Nitrospirae bacterium]|nr:bifunctional precorrin-2 dehydrogenase/sirohydrochlorin ferrochelatase [Nitrospirota bacterium]